LVAGRSVLPPIRKALPTTEWQVSDVADWLQAQKLSRLVAKFINNQIDGEAFLLLEETHLEGLGVRDNMRDSVVYDSALRKLKEQPEAGEESAPPHRRGLRDVRRPSKSLSPRSPPMAAKEKTQRPRSPKSPMRSPPTRTKKRNRSVGNPPSSPETRTRSRRTTSSRRKRRLWSSLEPTFTAGAVELSSGLRARS
jgi:hypothetical protein